MNLLEWAIKHNISSSALQDLCQSCLHLQDAVTETDHKSKLEDAVQREIRLEAARADMYLFRNNRGAGSVVNVKHLCPQCKPLAQTHIRWGLANDSKVLGDSVKSADLIGWRRIVVTPEMVTAAQAHGLPGLIVAQFLSVEVKRESYKFAGTLEEFAQVKWSALVNAQGGHAVITNKAGVL